MLPRVGKHTSAEEAVPGPYSKDAMGRSPAEQPAMQEKPQGQKEVKPAVPRLGAAGMSEFPVGQVVTAQPGGPSRRPNLLVSQELSQAKSVKEDGSGEKNPDRSRHCDLRVGTTV